MVVMDLRRKNGRGFLVDNGKEVQLELGKTRRGSADRQ